MNTTDPTSPSTWLASRTPKLVAAAVTELSRLDADALRTLPQEGQLHVDLAALAANRLDPGAVLITFGEDAAAKAEAGRWSWVMSFTYMVSDLIDGNAMTDSADAIPHELLERFERLPRDALFELAVQHVIAMDPTEVALRRLREEGAALAPS
ncbi:MAG: hypothetical protein KA769_08560 [Piscinibacter sp.]|uniref:hypothetical protein n=1 Tax=Piscinibacter sp. TaxID=1903157 RepID=UPI001B4E59C3|nr:hypothetical protein [Piscinibacter sp.]MBP6027386.1 hypothetical protein [Piscinibacter sp.]